MSLPIARTSSRLGSASVLPEAGASLDPVLPLPEPPEADLPEQHRQVPRAGQRLGEGATSEVYLARDEFARPRRGHQARHAGGILPDSREGQHYQQHFFASRGGAGGQACSTRTWCSIFDAVFDAPVEPYLVMEYVPGPTLRRFCRA